MEIQTIELKDLKPSKINVRKKDSKNVTDLVPSIRANGLLQPLVVRKNCEGFEVIAGQRRYYALSKISEEKIVEPIPCIVMKSGDDAAALEASLAENFARLPMDEVDQFKAFAQLEKQGKTVDDIASSFGITERLVKQRLALGNLISPILTAYQKEKISAGTLRSLTLASKAQQKQWWALFQEGEYAPQGHALKEWLFGGSDIKTSVAIFDTDSYRGNLVSDLFGDAVYFDDSEKFWELQNAAIAQKKEAYIEKGWQDVIILDVGSWFCNWEHEKTPKTKGGHVYVQIRSNGEVDFHEGFLTKKQAQAAQKAFEAGEDAPKTKRPEMTKALQNYFNLHRHNAVRNALLKDGDTSLRLVVAHIIAGSNNWDIKAEPRKANTEAIDQSVSSGEVHKLYDDEEKAVRKLLDISDENSIVDQSQGYYQQGRDFHQTFSKLLSLTNTEVLRILTFVMADTLESGTAIVEVLGDILSANLSDHWKPDDTFFDLTMDKEAINAMVKQVAGKATADANISATAKVQKKIIQDCLNGTRKGKSDWTPRYSRFPMQTYTKRDGIDVIDRHKEVEKHYAA